VLTKGWHGKIYSTYPHQHRDHPIPIPAYLSVYCYNLCPPLHPYLLALHIIFFTIYCFVCFFVLRQGHCDKSSGSSYGALNVTWRNFSVESCYHKTSLPLPRYYRILFTVPRYYHEIFPVPAGITVVTAVLSLSAYLVLCRSGSWPQRIAIFTHQIVLYYPTQNNGIIGISRD